MISYRQADLLDVLKSKLSTTLRFEYDKDAEVLFLVIGNFKNCPSLNEFIEASKNIRNKVVGNDYFMTWDRPIGVTWINDHMKEKDSNIIKIQPEIIKFINAGKINYKTIKEHDLHLGEVFAEIMEK